MSFGSAACDSPLVHKWPLLHDVCAEVLRRIDQLLATTPEAIEALPEEQTEWQTIRDSEVRFSTVREPSPPDGTLVVVQAFFRTWRHANYIALGGAGGFAGRIFAEGVLLTSDRRLIRAPDQLLWTFR
jgi:hypothetical protein